MQQLLLTTIIFSLLFGCGSKSSKKSSQSEAAPATAEPSTPVTPNPAAPIEKLKPAKPSGEFVSGALDLQETPYRKYKVLSSAGSANKEIIVKTLHGYKVYFSGQGVLLNSLMIKQ